MLKIYMGPILASTEFTKFDLGVTSDPSLSVIGRWMRIMKEGAVFDDSGFIAAQRRWRVPVTLEEVVLSMPNLKMAALYNSELRMGRLLRSLKDMKIDLVTGYLRSESYNPYELIASGWGCAQTTGVPTIVVNITPETVCYSLFLKMDEVSDGMISLAERYTMVSVPVEKKEYTQKK